MLVRANFVKRILTLYKSAKEIHFTIGGIVNAENVEDDSGKHFVFPGDDDPDCHLGGNCVRP